MEENVNKKMDISEDQLTLAGVPLFLRKLWKLVNDQENEHIICWNKTENGFLILDQLEFIMKLLPHYFKHNNMSSFVRQLNFYNFHKVASVNDEIEFVHKCFIKGVPEVLILIKRKSSVVKQKGLNMDEELKDFLNDVKNLRNKNALIQKELILLKQENMTLWSELNSLRTKYEKQSSIINKLINFLISYIHTHQTSYGNEQNMGVPRRSNQNNLKSSPKILELDYRDKQKNVGNKTDETSYAMFQPGSSNSHGTITYSVKIPESLSKTKKNVPSLQEILSQNHGSHSHNNELRFPMNLNRGTQSDEITYSIKLPADQTGKMVSTDIQKSLFELLNENKRLSMENSLEDLLTEINAVDEPVMDMGVEFRKPIQEFEPAFSNPAGNTYYTVSYPKELVQNIQSQKDTSVTTSILQTQKNDSSTAPAKFSKIIEVNNNMNTQPEFTDTKKNSSLGEIRSQKDNSTDFQPNLYTSNNEELFDPSPSGVSSKSFKVIKTNNSNESIEMVNQSLLDILKENENLSGESTNDYTLGTQLENSIKDSTVVPLDTLKKLDVFPQRNMESTSLPILEPASNIEIEYFVEAPDPNLNLSSDKMEWSVLQQPMNRSSIISPSVSVGSKNYNILSKPNSYVGQVECPIKNKPSLGGNRQHQRNTNLQMNKATSTKVETRKRLKSADTEAILKSFKTKPVKMTDSLLDISRGKESLSCENPNDGLLRTHGNSKVVPGETNNQLMQKMRLIPKKYGKQTIGMPSEIRTDELPGTIEPTVQNPEIRDNISSSSVPLGSQKLNLLRNPNVRKVNKAGNEIAYPIKDRSILVGSQQRPSNTKLQINTDTPAEMKSKVNSRKRLKSAEAEPTLKSFKIPKTKSIGIEDSKESKVKQSLLNILKENEHLSVENPKNTIIVPSDQPMRNIELLLQENGEPLVPIESPAASDEIECQYIVQTPDSNSNPGIDDVELTEILDQNLDELPETIPELTVEKSPNTDITPPFPLSVGNDEFNILENPNSYLESPQDDLNVLQEILNNLDSKDLSDILSNESNMNVENLSYLEDENPIDIPMSQANSSVQEDGTNHRSNSLLDSTALVDQYFSPHFFDQNVQ